MSAAADVGTTRWPADGPTADSAGFADRLLNFTLFITIVASSIVFVEPSPHDALMLLLLFVCVIARVKFEPTLLPALVLLIIWNAGGVIALLNVPDTTKAIQYAATSLYLAVAAILFGCLFAQDTMRRLDTLRVAYIATAVLAALIGVVGYFRVFPVLSEDLTLYGRARGTFKDPNVFGPFLIWPSLIVMTRMITGRIGVKNLAIFAVLLAGIFLSFSRGAWVHFGISCGVMLALSLLTASSSRVRLRIVLFSLVVMAMIGGCLVLLLSIESVKETFTIRAQAIQSYDTGEGGRFRMQERAFGAILDHPFGMGPFEFSRVFGQQQHNEYQQAFLVYGWIGGAAFIALMAITLLYGLRAVFVPAPWQPYILATFSTFVGVVCEGIVVDTDHWRHLYLLIGIIWGVVAATAKRAPHAPGRPAHAAPAQGMCSP